MHSVSKLKSHETNEWSSKISVEQVELHPRQGQIRFRLRERRRGGREEEEEDQLLFEFVCVCVLYDYSETVDWRSNDNTHIS